MTQNSRLSDVLHVLLHMAHASEPVTSEMLAKPLNTNPVVLRRILAGLRDHGYVRSEKGHGGGWTLACDFSRVTLRDIYQAIGSPALLALSHRSDEPECLIERAVNSQLDQSLLEAEQLLLTRFGEVTLAMLQSEVQLRSNERLEDNNIRNIHTRNIHAP